MTRKEFKEHDWKDGEYLYEIVYNTYLCYSIPWKISRCKVRLMDEPGWIHLTKKKTVPYGIYDRSPFLKDFFFTKEAAQKRFDKICKEFVGQKARIRQCLQGEWYRAHNDFIHAQAKINGLLRMNIMNDGQ